MEEERAREREREGKQERRERGGRDLMRWVWLFVIYKKK